MVTQYEDLIKKAYAAFNARDIDAVLSVMHPAVHWSNGWEGGYVIGHEEVRNYWIRQWKELDPNVEPIGFSEREDGSLEVEVHQKVKDLQGNLLFDGTVKHIYRIESSLIRRMDIEKA
ncbi:MAG: nuclear transport factor 2 family protein [Flavisolibacter sp.]